MATKNSMNNMMKIQGTLTLMQMIWPLIGIKHSTNSRIRKIFQAVCPTETCKKVFFLSKSKPVG